MFRQQLQQLETWHEAATGKASYGAQEAADAVRPISDPETIGETIRGAADAERAPTIAQGQAAADQRVDAIASNLDQVGGQAALGTPDQRAAAVATMGQQMRDPIAEANRAMAQRTSALYEAVDPTGTMGVRAAPAQTAVDNAMKGVSVAGGSRLGADEANFAAQISAWPQLVPFNTLREMNSNIFGRMSELKRTVGTQSPEYRRLAIMKGGVEDSLADAVDDIAQGETAGVIHHGLPGVAERLGARLENLPGIGPSFAQDVAAAYANNPASLRAAGRDETGRGILETANAAPGPVRAGTAAGLAGEGVSQGRGLGGSPSDPSLSQTPDLTPLTPEALQTYQQAQAAHAERKQLFWGRTAGQKSVVGKILTPGGAYGPYRLTDAQVPWRVFNAGPTAREDIGAYLDAAERAGNGQDAVNALHDAAAFSLRRDAQNPNGTLNRQAYARWMDRHDAALSDPRLENLRSRFEAAGQAQRELDQISGAQAAFEKANPIRVGWENAELASKFFAKGPVGAAKMRQFSEAVGDRPDAMRSMEDWAAHDFANAAVRDGRVNANLAERWLRDHDAALSVFPQLKHRFADAAEAQRTAEDAIASHIAARQAFEKSSAGIMLGEDPVKAIGRVFTDANAPKTARELMKLTAHSPEAQNGLRRAAVEYIRQKLEGSTPAVGTEDDFLRPGQFRKWVDANDRTLNELFPDGIGRFRRIADDLRRSSLTTSGSKIGTGSDTAQNASLMQAHDDHGGGGLGGWLSAIGMLAGEHVTGSLAPGIATIVGSKVLTNAKNAVQARTNALLDEALMDTQAAHLLWQANPIRGNPPPPNILNRLRGRLVQLGVNAGAAAPAASGQKETEASNPPAPSPAAPPPPASRYGGNMISGVSRPAASVTLPSRPRAGLGLDIMPPVAAPQRAGIGL